MATVPVLGVQRVIALADNATTLNLGDGGDSKVGTYVLHFVNDNTFAGTLTVQTRGRKAPDTVSPVPVPYVSQYVNGAVGTGAYVSTVLTTNSLVIVPASGQAVCLAVTCTSGSGTLYITRLGGDAA